MSRLLARKWIRTTNDEKAPEWRLGVYLELRRSCNMGYVYLKRRTIPMNRCWCARAWEYKPHMIKEGMA